MESNITTLASSRGNKLATGTPRIRRALAFGAVVSSVALVVAACGSTSTTKAATSTAASSGVYGHLPPVSTATTGGTITMAQIKTATPLYASPIAPESDDTDYTFDDFINLYNQPVYWSPDGDTEEVNSSLSMADAPTFSHGDKTVSIKLKSWKWSTGTPVTAGDMVAYIDIAKAAVQESSANFEDYGPGLFPSNVATATATNASTLVLTLTKKLNPGYFYDDQLNLLYALPSQWMVDTPGGKTLNYEDPADAKLIYNYLNKEAGDLSTIGSDPLFRVSDGPMELTSFNATTDDYTMKPNPDYSGPQKAKFTTLKVETFTSEQAVFDEMEVGGIDIGPLDQSDLPAESHLTSKGYSVFGAPSFGFQGAFLNFKDKTGDFDNIIGQLYVREALTELTDQPAYVTGIWKDAAVPQYTTVPSSPKSPYAPADASDAPYPYSPSAAKKLLTSHGWKDVSGTMTCENSRCGKDIPTGTKLAFTWVYNNIPVETGEESTAFASEARSIGVQVTLKSEAGITMYENYNDPSAPANLNAWAVSDFGGDTLDIYPTTETFFNTGGGQNLGDFGNSQADTLINNSVDGDSQAAVTAESSYLGKEIPMLFAPDPDYIYAVKDTVGGTSASWLSLTQFAWTPEYWYQTTKG